VAAAGWVVVVWVVAAAAGWGKVWLENGVLTDDARLANDAILFNIFARRFPYFRNVSKLVGVGDDPRASWVDGLLVAVKKGKAILS
jgi:hypothetical protein